MASNSSLASSAMDLSPAQDIEGVPSTFPPSPEDVVQDSLTPAPAEESPARKPSFELVGSSLSLRNFVPVKILRKYDGGHRPFEVCFPAEVLLRPISGTYGNYVGASGGKRYAPPALKCKFFPICLEISDLLAPQL